MNRYLEKLAASLNTHQERALKKFDREDGIILDHSTGSGKTITFLKAVEKYQNNNKDRHAVIIAPASLVSNIHKEINNHNIQINPSKLSTLSYEKAVNEIDDLQNKNPGLVVFDEAHRLRNVDTKRHKELSKIISLADKRILATATTAYNNANDIAPLVNIAAGYDILPEDKKKFEARYVSKIVERPNFFKRLFGAQNKEYTTLKNSEELKNILQKYIDYYDFKEDPTSADKFASKSEVVYEVPMSESQEKVYKFLEGNVPAHIRKKIRNNLPLNKQESASLNAFSAGIRQASNSTSPYDLDNSEITPKIEKAVNNLILSKNSDSNFKGIVYSNYLAAGLSDYSKKLSDLGIPHSVYHGGLNRSEKDQMVKDYNNGNTPILLISSSGAEGLDLKGTKKVQILEPHFNKSKISQIIGRGVRFKAHEHLPESERHVTIEHYHSTLPDNILGKSKSLSIDQYLYRNSDTKDELVKQIKKLLVNRSDLN